MTFLSHRGQILGGSMFGIWRVLIISAVILVISLSVGGVFVSKQDVRPIEAALLSKHFAECIAPQGVLYADFNLDNCITGGQDYFVSAEIKSFDSDFLLNKSIENSELRVGCDLTAKGVEYKQGPFCLSQSYYVLIQRQDKIEKGILSLDIGIGKVEQNV